MAFLVEMGGPRGAKRLSQLKRSSLVLSSLLLLVATGVAAACVAAPVQAAWTEFSSDCQDNQADEVDLYNFNPESGKGYKATGTGVVASAKFRSKHGSGSHAGRLGYINVKHSQDQDIDWIKTYTGASGPVGDEIEFNALSEQTYTSIETEGTDECGLPIKPQTYEWRACLECGDEPEQQLCQYLELHDQCESDMAESGVFITNWKRAFTALIPGVSWLDADSDTLYAAAKRTRILGNRLVPVWDPYSKQWTEIPLKAVPPNDAIKYKWHVYKIGAPDAQSYTQSCTNLWAVSGDWTFTINWEYGDTPSGCNDEGKWKAEVTVYDSCGLEQLEDTKTLTVDSESGARIKL